MAAGPVGAGRVPAVLREVAECRSDRERATLLLRSAKEAYVQIPQTIHSLAAVRATVVRVLNIKRLWYTIVY